MFLVDGSALRLTVIDSSYPLLPGEDPAIVREAVAWRTWRGEHEPDVAVTEIGLMQLRRTADPLGPEARETVRQLVPRLTVLRIPDRAMTVSPLVTPVLGPFDALHLGLAVVHHEIATIVTYERDLARLARMYALEVLSPGRDDAWWV